MISIPWNDFNSHDLEVNPKLRPKLPFLLISCLQDLEGQLYASLAWMANR